MHTYSMNRFMSEEQKKDHEESLKKTTVFLGQVASLLRKKAFARWYASNESRFDWAGERLAAKLRRDLMFQVDQAVRARGLTDIEALKALADLIDRTVDETEKQGALKITKKERSFITPRGAEVTESILQFLSRSDTKGMVRELPDGFYVWNAVSSLMTYARARDTLANPTGDAVFETVLSELSEGYLVDGYPHDLLSHDAHDLRTGTKYKALIMRTGYCSTMAVKPDEELHAGTEDANEYRIIHFKNAA